MTQDSNSSGGNQTPGSPRANTMWGGRFAGGPDAIMAEINASIGFDQRFAAEDIAGSRARPSRTPTATSTATGSRWPTMPARWWC